jgi:hemerythrin-like domain-containing protein
MGIQIGAKPDAGFDDPIGMLKDCHRRIEHFLNILSVVVERARGRELTAEESEAVEAALQYFHLGGQRHNADEEESLFPRLRAEGRNGDLGEIVGLEGDHQRANELHGDVEDLYRRWISAGALAEQDQERLLAVTDQLRLLYEGHIRIEEETVFPRAAELLGSDAIGVMGEEFRARRK